jgi:hypothetical protein
MYTFCQVLAEETVPAISVSMLEAAGDTHIISQPPLLDVVDCTHPTRHGWNFLHVLIESFWLSKGRIRTRHSFSHATP